VVCSRPEFMDLGLALLKPSQPVPPWRPLLTTTELQELERQAERAGPPSPMHLLFYLPLGADCRRDLVPRYARSF
jgi:hypothetical protein